MMWLCQGRPCCLSRAAPARQPQTPGQPPCLRSWGRGLGAGPFPCNEGRPPVAAGGPLVLPHQAGGPMATWLPCRPAPRCCHRPCRRPRAVRAQPRGRSQSALGVGTQCCWQRESRRSLAAKPGSPRVSASGGPR